MEIYHTHHTDIRQHSNKYELHYQT